MKDIDFPDGPGLMKRMTHSNSKLIELLDWHHYIEGTTPEGVLLLIEVRGKNDVIDYHTGKFSSNATGHQMGRIAGHFHFDYEILRYADISGLIKTV
jgi:hypothetical protein